MPNWLAQLHKLLEESALVTLVTVINTLGSAPREVGARMLVTADRQWGTVGGGNLEFSAVAMARDRQLANSVQPLRQKFALGPALGQCCGGSVELLFESITRQTRLPQATTDEYWARRIDSAADICDHATSQLFTVAPDCPLAVVEEGEEIWLLETLSVRQPTAVVFGAGHVGLALVKQLTLLPCSIIWVDERNDLLVAPVGGEQVTTIQTECPEQEVEDLPDDAWFFVMTHSHMTDFDICLALLKKQRFSFLGLIGSDTKRNTFRKRFLQRGIATALIDRLCCPIGLNEISSSRPEAIALGVAASLQQHWEAADDN